MKFLRAIQTNQVALLSPSDANALRRLLVVPFQPSDDLRSFFFQTR